MDEIRVYQTPHGEVYLTRPGSLADELALSDEFPEFYFVGTIRLPGINHNDFTPQDEAAYKQLHEEHKNSHRIVERETHAAPQARRPIPRNG